MILFAIRREGYSPMEEHFQVRPHFFEVLLARELHHAVENREHPRRHTAQVRNVLVESLVGNAVTLLFEVTEQGGLFLGNADEIDQRIDVLDENGTEVTYERVFLIVVRCMTSAKDEGVSIEDATFSVVPEIPHHSVCAAPIMCIVQTIAAHRNEFALVVGRSARLRIPAYLTRPKHIPFTMTHALNVFLQFFVGVDI